jgi:hypothetical protein
MRLRLTQGYPASDCSCVAQDCTNRCSAAIGTHSAWWGAFTLPPSSPVIAVIHVTLSTSQEEAGQWPPTQARWESSKPSEATLPVTVSQCHRAPYPSPCSKTALVEEHPRQPPAAHKAPLCQATLQRLPSVPLQGTAILCEATAACTTTSIYTLLLQNSTKSRSQFEC